MTSQPSGQPAQGPVRWGLAAGMFLLIALILAFATGLFSQGTQSGPPSGQSTIGTPTGTPDESATASSSASTSASSSPALDELVGTWHASNGYLLAIAPEGSFKVTQGDTTIDEGAIAVGGGEIDLTSANGTHGTGSLLGPDRLLIRTGLVGSVEFHHSG